MYGQNLLTELSIRNINVEQLVCDPPKRTLFRSFVYNNKIHLVFFTLLFYMILSINNLIKFKTMGKKSKESTPSTAQAWHLPTQSHNIIVKILQFSRHSIKVKSSYNPKLSFRRRKSNINTISFGILERNAQMQCRNCMLSIYSVMKNLKYSLLLSVSNWSII